MSENQRSITAPADPDLAALATLAARISSRPAQSSPLGVAAATALIANNAAGAIRHLADQLAPIVATVYQAPPPKPPTGSTGPGGAGKASADACAGTIPDLPRIQIAALIDQCSIDALCKCLTAALADSFKHPFDEVLCKIKEMHDEHGRLQMQHSVEQRRVVDLHETTEMLAREVRELRINHGIAAERFNGLYAQHQGTVGRLRDLHNVVADMGVGLSKMEETTDAVEQLMEVVEDEVAHMTAKLQHHEEPPAPPTPPTNRPSQKKR